MGTDGRELTRREFLKRSAVTAAAVGAGLNATRLYALTRKRTAKHTARKVIVIGIDGMDPRLSERMMNEGLLPNFSALREGGGYSRLGTSIPPQSPVAWANFINGADPGSHGIFDFIHRDPVRQCYPFFSVAETVSGQGYWETGDHKVQLDFWPFGHTPPQTLLRRQGIPFWDYLDEAGISSQFYNLPSNYPPSPSKHGNHRCLAGMGTPDLLGTYGTYQHFAADGPLYVKEEGGGRRSPIFFENDTSVPSLQLLGPQNTFLRNPREATIDFVVHRDGDARAAVIEIQRQRILLQEGQWSRWIKLDFELSMPAFMTDKHVSGICRFYLQQVAPNFRLYVSPINTDPSDPATKITEPATFIEDISKELGLFYTTGFQEDHKALSNGVFSDAEFATQAGMVLEERLNLLNYALKHYDDGLLFFYFSSTDLQGHMMWWDSDRKHPTRSTEEAKQYFEHLKGVYRKMDSVMGDLLKRYGDRATILAMSDHGFANFRRQFNLNTWLRDNGFLQPAGATSVLGDVDWSGTQAFGLGINALYLNLKGRERDGIVSPGARQEELLDTLTERLEAVRDTDGRKVIHKVHRTDKAYSGKETKLAPDLIVGYARDYRASWST
ncbi:MAG: alkaline phosphatase family protein, partial [Planctomycetota bacterium]